MNHLFIFEMQSWYNTYDQQGNHRNNNEEETRNSHRVGQLVYEMLCLPFELETGPARGSHYG